jgi:hypothetical protein
VLHRSASFLSDWAAASPRQPPKAVNRHTPGGRCRISEPTSCPAWRRARRLGPKRHSGEVSRGGTTALHSIRSSPAPPTKSRYGRYRATEKGRGRPGCEAPAAISGSRRARRSVGAPSRGGRVRSRSFGRAVEDARPRAFVAVIGPRAERSLRRGWWRRAPSRRRRR